MKGDSKHTRVYDISCLFVAFSLTFNAGGGVIGYEMSHTSCGAEDRMPTGRGRPGIS